MVGCSGWLLHKRGSKLCLVAAAAVMDIWERERGTHRSEREGEREREREACPTKPGLLCCCFGFFWGGGVAPHNCWHPGQFSLSSHASYTTRECEARRKETSQRMCSLVRWLLVGWEWKLGF